MIIFISLLMAAAAIAFIAYPLLKQRMGLEVAVENEVLQELSSKRDTTYAMLKEVEFDYQSGILIEEDYQALQDRYKQKAVSILKEIHSVAEEDDQTEKEISEIRSVKQAPAAMNKDEDIEKEILRLRKSKNRPPVVKDEEDLEQEIRSYRKPRTVNTGYCTRCGTRYETGDQFCGHCGAELKHKEMAS